MQGMRYRRAPIRTTDPALKAFFERAEELGFTLRDVERILGAVFEYNPPAYRTIQAWRRGDNTPRLLPMDRMMSALEYEAER